MTGKNESNGDESRIARRRTAARTEASDGYIAKRDRLIAVAAEVFREKGFGSATLGDIADKFGTDRASLYYYVAGKDELLQEAISGILARNVAEADRIAALDADARTKVGLLTRQILLSYEENYPYTFVFVQEEHRIAEEDSAWAQQTGIHSHQLVTHMIAFIEEGMSDGTFRTDLPAPMVANALFGMINSTHRWFRPGGRPMSEVSDIFLKIFIEGVRSPSSDLLASTGDHVS